ncbi:MAG: terpene cyclase/mutase family protein [Pirellulales bacterium]|nr:terpene cyclase/mutase family protein [Pirellulales bacterium]
MEGHDGFATPPAWADDSTPNPLSTSVRRAILRTRRWLFDQQRDDGCWAAELEGDTILESETVLLLAFLGQEDSHLAHRLARHMIRQQLPDGGWAMYPGGKIEISGSVKAYFALKLTGHDPSSEYMQRARRAILAHGGADAVNSFTRFYLALLGQIPYSQCPAVPPEIVLLPKWFPVNLYAVSSWSRTIIVPLSIVSAVQPVRRVDASRGIRELFIAAPENWPALRCPGLPGRTGLFSWDRFFRTVDRMMKWCQQKNLLPCRGKAIRAAERWMIGRFEGSDGLGAIYPPIVWSLIALRCLGYDDESPEVCECRKQLDDLVLEEEDGAAARLQPCKSPVWDTAITLRALHAGGVRPEHPSVARAVDWLLDKQITRPGDWSETVGVDPGGWCFEHNNDFYPDSDDTAMVLMALAAQFEDARRGPAVPGDLRVISREEPDEAELREAMLGRTADAIRRGLAWMLAMQNDDGGWGAFDRNNNRQFLCYVPFADHNAMIDPSTPDLTGRVLEALGTLGRRVGDPAVDRAVAYLRSSQEPDGSWFGRWGVNYVYGTWQALTGLASVGVPSNDLAVVAGAQWLISHQQPSGGWGESPDTYEDPRLRGQGPTTASQTAWAILGLLAAGMEDHPSVARAVQYLVDRQQSDGTWHEAEFTGTGFPRVFYLRYHYYPIYFPLIALGRWAATAAAPLAATAAQPAALVAHEGRSCVAAAAAF